MKETQPTNRYRKKPLGRNNTHEEENYKTRGSINILRKIRYCTCEKTGTFKEQKPLLGIKHMTTNLTEGLEDKGRNLPQRKVGRHGKREKKEKKERGPVQEVNPHPVKSSQSEGSEVTISKRIQRHFSEMKVTGSMFEEAIGSQQNR